MEDILISIIFLILIIGLICIIISLKDENSVDIVYTWVDSNDPQWLKGYNEYFNNRIFDARISNTKNSWDELELSIKLVRKNLPWVNNIYVVTQRPQSPPIHILSKVKLVHHDQIGLNHNTYSSMSIESLIHKIPGLSERFIYFNDDMYVLKPMKKTDFFTKRGVPLLQINQDLQNLDFKPDNLFIRNLKHMKKLLLSKGIPYKCITHTPTPMTKRLMGKTKTLFKDAWTYTQLSKIRNANSIIPLYLASCVGLHMNNCKEHNNIKIFFSGDDIPKSNEYDIACINSITQGTFDKFIKSL